MSTVDGQATFFELDRQNMRIHELFRGYSLRRNYDYRPTLPTRLNVHIEDASSLVDSRGKLVRHFCIRSVEQAVS